MDGWGGTALSSVESVPVSAATSPFAVSVLDLARRPGDARALELDAAAPERIGNAVIGIAAGTVVHIDGRLESLHEGVLVSAEIEAELDGECVRCLTAVTQPLRVEFQELFAYTPDEAFDYLVQNDAIDLDQVVRDTVVPALPFQPVCVDDCPGLCQTCGVRLLDEPGHAHEPQIDARWAALSALATQDPNDQTTEADA